MKKIILLVVLALFTSPFHFSRAAIQPVGALIKGSNSTVYYFASNGYRYAFSDAGTYFSWFSDFSSVKTISDVELSSIPLRGMVTYRPGIRLIKIQSDPKVYAIDRGRILRWVQTEASAAQMYGEHWMHTTADVSDALFVNYTIGAPISGNAEYRPEIVSSQVMTIDANLGLIDTPSSPRSDTSVLMMGSAVSGENQKLAGDILPELLPFAPSQFHMDTLNGRTILRFTASFWNAGDAPFELTSKSSSAVSIGDDYLNTYQHIRQQDGTFRDVLVGKFLWHAMHEHYHYGNFADYVLEPVNQSHNSAAPVKTITQKTTFCMRDDEAVKLGPDGNPFPRILSGHCGRFRQVVSVGWADVYRYTLPDQYFDVNDLPAGVYRASFVIDPRKSFTEKSQGNNTSATFIQLDPRAGTVSVISSAAPFPTPKNSFPDGMMVRAEQGTKIYAIHNNKKRLLKSDEVGPSSSVFELPGGVLDALPTSNLIRLAGTSAVYVVSDSGYRRRMLDPGVMTSYGFSSADVADVSRSEFESYPETDLIVRAGDNRVFSINQKRKLGTLDMLPALGLQVESVHVANDTDFEANAVEVVAQNLSVPWDVGFLPDGDMIATERPGVLRRFGAQPAFINIPSVKHTGEGGLMGLALHPDFATNHLLYIYFTALDGGQKNRVVRFRFENNLLTEEKTIIDNIPSAIYHDGGQITFGPDGMLYLTTGDANSSELAQNPSSLAGKTLRLTPDGGIPSGNPFGTAVWSFGHRNAQGIAWDAQGRMWQTEHGRSGALSGLDELNLVEIAKNYGWPIIEGKETKQGMVNPALNSGADVTWAPSGMAFVDGRLFFAGLKGASLYEATPGVGATVHNFKAHFVNKYGRLRAVVVGPDGNLYVTTSNDDGRGTPNPGDDKILRINPEFLR